MNFIGTIVRNELRRIDYQSLTNNDIDDHLRRLSDKMRMELGLLHISLVYNDREVYVRMTDKNKNDHKQTVIVP